MIGLVHPAAELEALGAAKAAVATGAATWALAAAHRSSRLADGSPRPHQKRFCRLSAAALAAGLLRVCHATQTKSPHERACPGLLPADAPGQRTRGPGRQNAVAWVGPGHHLYAACCRGQRCHENDADCQPWLTAESKLRRTDHHTCDSQGGGDLRGSATFGQAAAHKNRTR